MSKKGYVAAVTDSQAPGASDQARLRQWAIDRGARLRERNGVRFLDWAVTVAQDFSITSNGWIFPNGAVESLAARGIDYLSLQVKELERRIWTTPARAQETLAHDGLVSVVPQYVWTRNPLEFKAVDKSFAHLHVRSDYSYHESCAQLRDLCERAFRLGQPAIALTDRHRLLGSWKFREEVAKRKMTWIVGCTVLVAARSRKDRGGDNHELVLLAMSEQGWRNLLKIVSGAWTEGFYREPRVDHELLAQYADDIVCFSGGVDGRVLQSFAAGDQGTAEDEIERLRGIFGDRFYLELAPWTDPYSVAGLPRLAKYAQEHELPVVVTGDVQWTNPWDTDIARIIKADSTRDKRVIAEPEDLIDPSLKETDEQRYEKALEDAQYKVQAPLEPVHHISTADEVRELFERYHPAVPWDLVDRGIAATTEIVQQHQTYTIDKKFKLPQGGHGIDVFDVAKKNLEAEGLLAKKPYQERFDMECRVVRELNFIPYFQLLHTLVAYLDEKEILKGPGRGSAAGSLLCYGLHVTDLDPLEHGLIFERFLNPGRCFAPGHGVLTSNGYKPIEQIQIGDYVLTRKGYRRVVATHAHPRIGLMSRVVVNANEQKVDFLCTPGHEWFINDGKSRACAWTLKPGDRIVACSQTQSDHRMSDVRENVFRPSELERQEILFKELSSSSSQVSSCGEGLSGLRENVHDAAIRRSHRNLQPSLWRDSSSAKNGRKERTEEKDGLGPQQYQTTDLPDLQDRVFTQHMGTKVLLGQVLDGGPENFQDVPGLWSEIFGDEISKILQSRMLNIFKSYGVYERCGWLPTRPRNVLSFETGSELCPVLEIQRNQVRVRTENVYPTEWSALHAGLLLSRQRFVGRNKGMEGARQEEARRGTDLDMSEQHEHSNCLFGHDEQDFTKIHSHHTRFGIDEGWIRQMQIRGENVSHLWGKVSQSDYEKQIYVLQNLWQYVETLTTREERKDGSCALNLSTMRQTVLGLELGGEEGNAQILRPEMSVESAVVTGNEVCFYIGFVHNISVEECHEYYVDGVLVGNSNLPDVDIDIDAFHRDEVYKYLTQVYPHTANIPTAMTMKGKAAIKATYRALNLPLYQAELVCREVPDMLQNAPPVSLLSAVQQSMGFREELKRNRSAIDAAIRLEGTIVTQGQHPAGIVISPVPLDESLGLMIKSQGDEDPLIMVHAVMTDVDSMGFVKLDILASTTVTAVDKATRTVLPDAVFAERKAFLRRIPLNDKRVLLCAKKGDTRLSFQFNSNVMIQTAQKIKPTSFNDLVALNAIVRPGASAWVEEYAKGDYKPDEPALWPIVAETRGIILYQEQAIRVAADLAGFNLSAADNVRKSIGKKLGDLMKKLESQFVEGCVKNGIEESSAKNIFETIRAGSNYSFNKCLVGETPIKSGNGNVPINDMVRCNHQTITTRSYNIDDDTEYDTTCTEIVDSGIQEVFEITFDDGSKETCTMDHEFLCADGNKYKVVEIIKSGFDVVFSKRITQKHKIVFAKKIGKRQTYSLCIDDPRHNFVLGSGAVSGNSHAASYAQLAVWTLYLYVYYPAHYISAFINSYMGKKDRLLVGVDALRNCGLKVIAPDVNHLSLEFEVADDRSVQIGVGVLPFIKEGAVQAVQEHAPFQSLTDFYLRVPKKHVNKRVRKALALAGAFDRFGSRKAAYMAFDQGLKLDGKDWNEVEWMKQPDWTPLERTRIEIEQFGFQLSNPMQQYREKLVGRNWRPIRHMHGKGYKLTGGIIRDLYVWEPIEGEGEMARIQLDDGDGGGTVLIWKSAWPDVVQGEIAVGDFVFINAYPLEDDPNAVAVGPKGRVKKSDIFG